MKGPKVIFVLIFTILLLAIYYSIFLGSFLLHIRHIVTSTNFISKTLIFIELVTHILVIAGICGGIYSEKFLNGGVQVFFIGIVNLHVYFTVWLMWPIQ